MTEKPAGEKVNWGELVREYFPSASLAKTEFLLWECTSYPMGSVSHIRECLATYKATRDAGKQACEWCNKPVVEDKSQCQDCADAMTGAVTGYRETQ